MARNSRKRQIVSENATNWFDLPLEMRESVINEMDVKTRCKFWQCSKQCEDEVKNMKEFYINILIGRNRYPELSIGYSKSDLHYCMEFHEIDNLGEKQSIVVYKTVSRHSSKKDDGNRKLEVKWMKIEKGSAKNVRMRYLNGISMKYQHRIVKIEIDDARFVSIVEMSPKMEEMRNLTRIEVTQVDVRKYGLMDLPFIIRTDHCGFYQIKSYDFDDDNVVEYLKMWKNGELPRNLKYLSADCDVYDIPVDFKRVAKSVKAFDYYEQDNLCGFRFLLNYERESKCFCDVRYSSFDFTVSIETLFYDKVMEKPPNFID
ncbi:unnamed protein product [Caenorhabditis angaria]|uniref:F-box domain-containing protein n=1 Tax=Caenorhabditis angaria TaxID=860376 RepID=A0A9P1I8E0_9PELO|nr:unnamed protein product [Caenorhabditis angaria]